MDESLDRSGSQPERPAAVGTSADRLFTGDVTYRDNTKWHTWDWAVTAFLTAVAFVTGYYMPLAAAMPFDFRVVVVVGLSCSLPMVGMLLTRRLFVHFLVGLGATLIGVIYLIATWWPATASQFSGFGPHLSGMLLFLVGRMPLVMFFTVFLAYIMIGFVDALAPRAPAYTFAISGLAVPVVYMLWQVVLWLIDTFWVRGYFGGISIAVVPALWIGLAACLLCLIAAAAGTPVCKRLPVAEPTSDDDKIDAFLDKHVGPWLERRWTGLPVIVVGLGLIGLACWIGWGVLGQAWWEVPVSLISMFWEVPIAVVDVFLHPINLGETLLGAVIGPCLTAGGIVIFLGGALLHANHAKGTT